MNSSNNLPSISLIRNRLLQIENLVTTNEEREQLNKYKQKLDELIKYIDDFNRAFSNRGWVAYESLNFSVIKKALNIFKESGVAKAERYLVDYYNSDAIRMSISMLWGVEEFRDRLRLIKIAYNDCLCGRYHSCIPLLLMMIDGVFADANNNIGFFSEKSDVNSWDSIVGNNSGLQTIKSIFFKMRGTTNKGKISLPYRNGIMHGRDLGYANEEVAAKCWALLFAVRDLLSSKKEEEKRKEKFDIDSQKSLTDIINDGNLLINQLSETIDMDSFKRTPVISGIDYPVSGSSHQYSVNGPERRLVEFIELWLLKNYGEMASYIYRPTYVTLGQMKGRLSKTFRDKNVKSFVILSSNDISSCITEITANINISYKEDLDKEYELIFRLLYTELNSTDLVVNPIKNGVWKIAENFYQVSEIGTSLEWLTD